MASAAAVPHAFILSPSPPRLIHAVLSSSASSFGDVLPAAAGAGGGGAGGAKQENPWLVSEGDRTIELGQTRVLPQCIGELLLLDGEFPLENVCVVGLVLATATRAGRT